MGGEDGSRDEWARGAGDREVVCLGGQTASVGVKEAGTNTAVAKQSDIVDGCKAKYTVAEGLVTPGAERGTRTRDTQAQTASVGAKDIAPNTVEAKPR